MSRTPVTCVFVGGRDDAARVLSRLLASGLRAQEYAEPLNRPLEAMGGTQLVEVRVASEDSERARQVLAEMDFD